MKRGSLTLVIPVMISHLPRLITRINIRLIPTISNDNIHGCTIEWCSVIEHSTSKTTWYFTAEKVNSQTIRIYNVGLLGFSRLSIFGLIRDRFPLHKGLYRSFPKIILPSSEHRWSILIIFHCSNLGTGFCDWLSVYHDHFNGHATIFCAGKIESINCDINYCGVGSVHCLWKVRDATIFFF